MAAMLAFVTFSLTHTNLQAANIFSSLALFYGLRMPLNMLPMVIAQSIDAWVALGRIQSYLLAEEEQEKREIDSNQENAFDLIDASFTWETPLKPEEEGAEQSTSPKSTAEKTEPVDLEKGVTPDIDSKEEHGTFHFDKLNLAISRHELLAVVGGVASGKTSFLAALAQDMRRTSGIVTQGGSMAYCPQHAWIQNSSVRENITFGRPFDQQWYDQVVDACALRADFDMLPDGDSTEVGERGITLSGGQKQRLNIARAIYCNAPIVLLDDPLSAVDAQVGRHIFSEAICGLLNDKCRVLATHQLHVLSQCDRIVWLQDGQIVAVGTYDELMANNSNFIQMLSKTARHEDEKGDEEESNEDDIPISAEKAAEAAAEEESEPPIPETKSKLPLKAAVLMQTEEKGEKGIKWAVYYAYMKSTGSLWMLPLACIFVCLAQASNIMSTVWLSYWTGDTLSISNNIYVSVPPLAPVIYYLSTDCVPPVYGIVANEYCFHIYRSQSM